MGPGSLIKKNGGESLLDYFETDGGRHTYVSFYEKIRDMAKASFWV